MPKHEIDRTVGEQRCVALALHLSGLVSAQHLDVAGGDCVEEMLGEVPREALRRGVGESDVLVHLKGRHAGPVDVLATRQVSQDLVLRRRRGEDGACRSPRASSAAARQVAAASPAAAPAARPVREDEHAQPIDERFRDGCHDAVLQSPRPGRRMSVNGSPSMSVHGPLSGAPSRPKRLTASAAER